MISNDQADRQRIGTSPSVARAVGYIYSSSFIFCLVCFNFDLIYWSKAWWKFDCTTAVAACSPCCLFTSPHPPLAPLLPRPGRTRQPHRSWRPHNGRPLACSPHHGHQKRVSTLACGRPAACSPRDCLRRAHAATATTWSSCCCHACHGRRLSWPTALADAAQVCSFRCRRRSFSGCLTSANGCAVAGDLPACLQLPLLLHWPAAPDRRE